MCLQTFWVLPNYENPRKILQNPKIEDGVKAPLNLSLVWIPQVSSIERILFLSRWLKASLLNRTFNQFILWFTLVIMPTVHKSLPLRENCESFYICYSIYQYSIKFVRPLIYYTPISPSSMVILEPFVICYH